MDALSSSLDRLISTWRRTAPLSKRSLFYGLAQLTAPACLYLLARLYLTQKRPHILPSPRESVQASSSSKDLPYPLDALPGARDIPSPNGNTRAYEWGPKTGRKVLFIHGISTPCVVFASLAQKLVDEQGCRVLLFDLHGRGYSDTPDPSIRRQDMGLWTAQILSVLTSSELNWDRFTLVGYSMGGGIGANFTSYFPHLVESLVLIAPSGLLRHSRISRSSTLLYSNLIPHSWVEHFVRRRLQGPSQPEATSEREQGKPNSPQNAAESEVPSHPAHAEDSPAAPFPDRPQFSIAHIVSWELDAHPGFLPAFISSIQHAPVSDEHERWRLIGERCEKRRKGADVPGLEGNKVLVLLGETDSVIVADDVEEDATAALGEENVKVMRIRGGHDVPVVNAEGCCEEIVRLWVEGKR